MKSKRYLDQNQTFGFREAPESTLQKNGAILRYIYQNMVNYETQTDYLEKIFETHHKGKVRTILDLACGTGNHTFIFAKRGYDVTGIDISDEMIKVALEKRGHNTSNPEFFKMDMRNIRLHGIYDIAAVLFGGFGYMLEYEDVKKFLSSITKHLKPQSLLIFEFWHNSAILPMSTEPHGYRTWDRAEDENNLIIRLNKSKYDPQTNIHRVDFDFYVLNTKSGRMLDTFSECHLIKTYSISEIEHLLEGSNFKVLAFYDVSLSNKKRKLEVAGQSTFRVLAVASTKG